MKIERFYRSFLMRARIQDLRALALFKQRCWEEPAEADELRDTVLSRKRLEFIRGLVEQGILNEGGE